MRIVISLLIAYGLFISQARPASAQAKDPVRATEKEGEKRARQNDRQRL
jgi:hypothetical protein